MASDISLLRARCSDPDAMALRKEQFCQFRMARMALHSQPASALIPFLVCVST